MYEIIFATGFHQQVPTSSTNVGQASQTLQLGREDSFCDRQGSDANAILHGMREVVHGGYLLINFLESVYFEMRLLLQQLCQPLESVALYVSKPVHHLAHVHRRGLDAIEVGILSVAILEVTLLVLGTIEHPHNNQGVKEITYSTTPQAKFLVDLVFFETLLSRTKEIE